jgi:hypothetical protein
MLSRIARVDETARPHAAWHFYDAFGLQIGKDVDGVRTVFGWEGCQLVYESSEGGATQYANEPESFVPLAQFMMLQPVSGIQAPVGGITNRMCRRRIRCNPCRKGSPMRICSTTIATRSVRRC